MYIDTHAHLDFPELKPRLDSVLSNASLAGVEKIITVGLDAASNQAAVDIASAYPDVYAAVGWHPHDAERADQDIENGIRALAQHKKVVAIGEAGLDYYRKRSDPDKQREVFCRIVTLARSLDRPLIVHCREAFSDTLKILRDAGSGEIRGVFHCFSGGRSELEKALELDFFVSFTGNITYKNSHLPNIVKVVPVERLLLETDCPFMTPDPHRNKRNEPAFLPLTAEKIAEIKGLSHQDIARITRYNTYRLFGIGEAPQRSIAYPIRNSLYIALTSRCTNHCRFCPRSIQPVVKGHYIGIPQDQEPDFNEVIAAVNDHNLLRWNEIVFCGFGEPTIRFDLLIKTAQWLKSQGVKKIRLDTNGQGNLINGRDIVPEMKGLVDAVSISLNEHRADLYQALVQSEFGKKSFEAVLDFARKCVRTIPEVTLSVVSYPGVHIEAARAIAKAIGAQFRVREYNEVG